METSLSREVLSVVFFRFMSIPIHFEFQGFPDLLDSPGEDGLDGDDAPAVIMDVLVDTLLSLLPQSSAPMRTSIELVFKYFCDDIADDGLLQMLMVIKKNLKHARHKRLIGTTLLTTTGETDESDEQSDDSEAIDAVEEVIKEIPEASDDSDGGWDDDSVPNEC
ncbi:hypothetical protein L3X38_026871 [Prunus dulcis]|uniref:Uncharacterized protein n=1 Tax=Prunus dulcis TaxID=3755 RepID=A0AAD4YZU6_PRUDU|nr:hypothetical protein L3X38_026871 [Prunus dulcis]